MENVGKSLWVFDRVHSQIRFEAKYLLLSIIAGSFLEFEGSVEVDEQLPIHSEISFKIYSNSISTGNTERDNHLRSADFFDVKKFPAITFASTSIEDQGQDKVVHGLLLIKDVQKPISLVIRFLGTARDEHNNFKAAFHFEKTISRNEFHVSWNKNIVNDLVLIDDPIKIIGDIQLLRVGSKL